VSRQTALDSIRQRIGSLADRVRERLGRAMGRCQSCGKPTRSHTVNAGVRCHECHGSGPILVTDGGRKHENPVDAADVTDRERARMLVEWTERYRAEFGTVPSVMPVDAETKRPYIEGRSQLDDVLDPEFGETTPTEFAENVMVDAFEAARQIAEEGAVGFACYAGRQEFGTYHAAFVDHDSTDTFPSPTGEPTLEVLSGSGRGTHETYRNDPDDRVQNASVNGSVGEIRARNYYVILPGSIHPSGGVYHIVEDREITTLADADLEAEMRPASKRREEHDARQPVQDADGDGERPDDETIRERLEVAFERSPTGGKYRTIYDGRYASAGYSDRSAAEFALANWVDMWVGFGDQAVVASVLDAGNLQKWGERTDAAYRDSILANVGYQDWYADDDSEGSTGEDIENVAVLPESPRARAAANGWDWQSADRTDTTVTIDDARERTFEAIADAYEAGDHALVEALPTMGKSFGAIAAAAESGVPITILTGRGNQEQYQQFQQWCAEHGLRAKILPSVWRDCETFQGEHGEAIEATVKDWYRRGATGKDIHKDAEYELGEPLPCEGPAGRRCSYKTGWEFDAEEYDVLIGNYLHAHVDSAMQGRVPVFDEFPGDAFETSLDQWLAGAVTQFVQSHDDLPFDDHADLVEHRRDEQRRADALAWFDDHAPEREGRLAFASSDGHAAAPLATYTILAGTTKDLGNGWERASLPGFDGGVGLYDRERGRVHLHTPPSYRYTRGVVALDGTPTPRLWEIAIGSRLNHRSVLSDGERSEYLRDTLGLNIIRTTDAVKPYSGTADHVAVSQDRALIEAIGDEHGQNPSLLTTKTAKGVYREEGVLDDVRDAGHYGDLKGSNRRENTRLGAVIGSRNFGDRFVEKWGALAGEAVGEPDRSDPQNRGTNLSFGGGVGDDVLRHMREHETLQAVMRFGRDGRGATVYVHTNTLPGWVEDVLAGEGRVIGTWSDGMRQVLDTVRDRCEWTTREIAEHPAVEIGTRQVRDHLHTLVERGFVDREIEGNGFVWRDDGLHRVGEHGDVELAPADHDDLGEGERCEVSRSSIYTWEFRSPPGSSTGSDSVTTDHDTHPTTTATDHPDPPPDEAD
jgi:hypothetical protein